MTKNHEALSKNVSSPKINFTADRPHESHPTAWELTIKLSLEHVLVPKHEVHYLSQFKIISSKNVLS